MANAEQLALLLSNQADVLGGTDDWNEWRRSNPTEPIDLSGANLFKANLTGALLHKANLHDANLLEANLIGAILYEADLSEAFLKGANLLEADFRGARLTNAVFEDANLYEADFSYATLTGANFIKAELTYANFTHAVLNKANFSKATLEDTILEDAVLDEASFALANLFRTNFLRANMKDARLDRAIMVATDFRGAVLQGCHVYGISAWDIQLDDHTQQTDLIITQYGEAIVTVDNLKVAQFIYLLLNNREIREVIETIGRKVVLILGRFTEERLVILDTIRHELRNKGYTPVLFKFTGPINRNILETVGALAHLSRFVVADVTDPVMVIDELKRIVPALPSLPVKPILLRGSELHPFLHELSIEHPSLLSLYQYDDGASLLSALPNEIIAPAEKRATETEHLNRSKQSLWPQETPNVTKPNLS